MPEHGLQWLSRADLLSYEEMLRLCRVLIGLGINKVRITGGEPFVRKDLMKFLTELSRIEGLQQINLTTNGVVTAPLVPKLKKIGIRSVNLSLDTLDRERFFQITRRDELPNVLQTMEALLQHDIAVKINAVVMDGQNTDDLIPLAKMAQNLPVEAVSKKEKSVLSMNFSTSLFKPLDLLFKIQEFVRHTISFFVF